MTTGQNIQIRQFSVNLLELYNVFTKVYINSGTNNRLKQFFGSEILQHPRMECDGFFGGQHIHASLLSFPIPVKAFLCGLNRNDAQYSKDLAVTLLNFSLTYQSLFRSNTVKIFLRY